MNAKQFGNFSSYPIGHGNRAAAIEKLACAADPNILKEFILLECLGLRRRDSWGHSYFVVRGEILGFTKDEQLRKHLPRMFSLIKNES